MTAADRIRSITDRLATDLAGLIPDLLREHLSTLFGSLVGPAPPVTKKKKRKRAKVSVRRRATPASPRSPSRKREPAPTRAAPSPRSAAPQGLKRPTCGKCGQPGHNARSCGRTPKGNSHGTRPTAAPARAARASVDPPPPRLSSAERGALDKPCRDPNCRIVKLHAAHGETP